MKTISLLVALTFTAGISLFTEHQPQNIEVPELHTIKWATLSPSYSCRPTEEFQHGYANTALFLSPYSKQRNMPDLLFNGACKAEDYFHSSTAGDDMALIADLGAKVSLEEVTASRAFNLRRVHSDADYSKFAQNVKVQPNHTYAVLLNKRELRGLFIFTVVNYVPNEKVELKYAVKAYQIMQGHPIASSGFDWERLNTESTQLR